MSPIGRLSCVHNTSNNPTHPKSKKNPENGNILHLPNSIWIYDLANWFLYVAGAGATFQIQTQKLEIKAQSKVGSLDNVKHKPGGGEKKIFDDKDYLKNVEHSVALTTPPTQVNYVYISSK